jgi:hypothetical protein
LPGGADRVEELKTLQSRPLPTQTTQATLITIPRIRRRVNRCDGDSPRLGPEILEFTNIYQYLWRNNLPGQQNRSIAE